HDMSGASMYVTQFPCNTCAQAIIQVGIQHVIFASRKEHHIALNTAVEKMFADAGVQAQAYSEFDVADSEFIAGLDQLKGLYD
ncbi:MAG: deaminase, partial [Thiohalomonadales bacterium]